MRFAEFLADQAKLPPDQLLEKWGDYIKGLS